MYAPCPARCAQTSLAAPLASPPRARSQTFVGGTKTHSMASRCVLDSLRPRPRRRSALAARAPPASASLSDRHLHRAHSPSQARSTRQTAAEHALPLPACRPSRLCPSRACTRSPDDLYLPVAAASRSPIRPLKWLVSGVRSVLKRPRSRLEVDWRGEYWVSISALPSNSPASARPLRQASRACDSPYALCTPEYGLGRALDVTAQRSRSGRWQLLGFDSTRSCRVGPKKPMFSLHTLRYRVWTGPMCPRVHLICVTSTS